MNAKKYSLIIAILSIILLIAAAEEGEAPGFDMDFNIGLGVETFMEMGIVEETGEEGLVPVSYQKLSLSPDFSIGNFGIGLDIVFHYQFEGGDLVIRKLDWVPEEVTFGNVMELYLAKFKYIRWAHKNDPLYIKFGSIEDGLLGNGFILGGYSNTMFLPNTRIFGLSLDVDGALFNFPLVGIETFMGNVIDPDVIGLRPFTRPLFLLDIPVIKLLEVGATFAFDIDPFAYYDEDLMERDLDTFLVENNITTDDYTVFFWGLDVFQPIISNSIVSLAAFGDLAWDKQGHTGGAIGAGGTLLSIFNYGAQLRFIGPGFLPTYFNPYYDLARHQQYVLLNSAETNPFFVGWFASLGTSLLEDKIALGFTLDGPFGTVVEGEDGEDNPYNFPHLTGSLNLREGLIPGISFEATYDKILIRKFMDIFNFQGAVVSARINYQTGPAVISLFYQLQYDPVNGWASEDSDVTSGLESVIQLN